MPSGDLLKATTKHFFSGSQARQHLRLYYWLYLYGCPSARFRSLPVLCYTNKITHRLQFNCYFSAWQIAMRPGEIEKAGKVSGIWQWLWLWWSILLLPLLTLPNIRDLHSLNPMLWARQLYKQRETSANTSISSTNRPACRIVPLQISCWEVTSSSCSVLLLTWFGDFGSKSLPGLSGLERWEIGKLTWSQGCESKHLVATAGVKTQGEFKTHKHKDKSKPIRAKFKFLESNFAYCITLVFCHHLKWSEVNTMMDDRESTSNTGSHNCCHGKGPVWIMTHMPFYVKWSAVSS